MCGMIYGVNAKRCNLRLGMSVHNVTSERSTHGDEELCSYHSVKFTCDLAPLVELLKNIKNFERDRHLSVRRKLLAKPKKKVHASVRASHEQLSKTMMILLYPTSRLSTGS